MRSIRKQLVSVCAAVMVVGTLLAGCAGGHASLGTSSSTCFLALPTASQAVHGSGSLVGVKSFRATTLVSQISKMENNFSHGGAFISTTSTIPVTTLIQTPGPNASGPTGITPGTTHIHHVLSEAERQRLAKGAALITQKLSVFGKQEVCAIAYKGVYGPGSVQGALDPKASGAYALVIVPIKGGNPILAIVARKLPFSYRHLF